MGVTGGTASHFGTAGFGTWRRRCATAIAWVRLSKIDDYLVDNVSKLRLSDMNRLVNKKA